MKESSLISDSGVPCAAGADFGLLHFARKHCNSCRNCVSKFVCALIRISSSIIFHNRSYSTTRRRLDWFNGIALCSWRGTRSTVPAHSPRILGDECWRDVWRGVFYSKEDDRFLQSSRRWFCNASKKSRPMCCVMTVIPPSPLQRRENCSQNRNDRSRSCGYRDRVGNYEKEFLDNVGLFARLPAGSAGLSHLLGSATTLAATRLLLAGAYLVLRLIVSCQLCLSSRNSVFDSTFLRKQWWAPGL